MLQGGLWLLLMACLLMILLLAVILLTNKALHYQSVIQYMGGMPRLASSGYIGGELTIVCSVWDADKRREYLQQPHYMVKYCPFL